MVYNPNQSEDSRLVDRSDEGWRSQSSADEAKERR